jgi:transcriptional regulator
MAARRGYRTIRLVLEKRDAVAVYTSARVADALREIASKASLYEGVRLMQILEAVYEQGRKDGARVAFEELDRSLVEVKREIPHQKPGRPRKRQ